MVCESWLVAAFQSSTWMIDFSGSITRSYATAFTFTETLSREMTSCGGTSSTRDARSDADRTLDIGDDDRRGEGAAGREQRDCGYRDDEPPVRVHVHDRLRTRESATCKKGGGAGGGGGPV